MLACVLQESIEKKYGGNPTYLAYKKEDQVEKDSQLLFLVLI
jgi:hypothetical protein